MKATTIFNIAVIGALSVFSISAYSQTSIDALKKEIAALKLEKQKLSDENNFLNQKLDFCTQLAKDKPVNLIPFSDIYEMQLLKCKGNRVNQTVSVELVISHKTTNQKVWVDNSACKAIDVLAKEYSLSEIVIGNENGVATVFTDTPVRMKATFKNILPGTEAFRSVMLRMATTELDGYDLKHTFTQISNLPIEW